MVSNIALQSKRVLISGGVRGLEEHRKLAKQTVYEMGMTPTMLEDIPLGDEIIPAVQTWLDTTDILVLIIGQHYGWIPDGFAASISEITYHWAREKKIPCLVFFMSDKHPKQADETSNNFADIMRISNFQNEITKQYVVGFFDSAEDLRTKLLLALSRYQRDNVVNIHVADVPNSNIVVNQFDEIMMQDVILRALELYEARLKTDPTRVDGNDPDAITIKPVFNRVSRAQQFQCDVFVIMPFRDEFDTVYNDIIVPLGESMALVVKRGDNFTSNHHIMDEVWYALYNCRVVVADCTGNNPNVFYELGIAHTLGKPVIMIAQDVEKAPFDVRGRRFIRYENNIGGVKKLKTELEKSIRSVLNNAE
ncbi:MAG: DUF4062 domain-containing protein [bacterium]|nr:DUF4062 domain-containing protein [bacterium]